MKGICGIDIEIDKIFLSFACSKKLRLKFYDEVELETSLDQGSVVDFLKANSEALNREIQEKESEHSFKVAKIYLKLPWNTEKVIKAESIIPFKKSRKISPRNVLFVKKYLEDASLEWDDFCFHHFILNCEIDGNFYNDIPLGIWAQRIKLTSLLFAVKDKLREETWSIFDNLGRNFSGFVSSAASIFSTAFDDKNISKVMAVINIGFATCQVVVVRDEKISFLKEYDFGIRAVINAMEKEFSLSSNLAQELFNRYIHFAKDNFSDVDKALSIKNTNTYVSMSIRSLNTFVKNFIKIEISAILEAVKNELIDNTSLITFTGRLNNKSGFHDFIKDFVPFNIHMPFSAKSISSSYGCVKYGLNPFLESNHKIEGSLLSRVLNLYGEYF